MTIDYDNIKLNPQLRDVMQRVREVGLHKVAAHIYGVREFGIKEAAQVLGTALITNSVKRQKIASGIAALNALTESGDVKLAGLFSPKGPSAFSGLIPVTKPRAIPPPVSGISKNMAQLQALTPGGAKADPEMFARMAAKAYGG